MYVVYRYTGFRCIISILYTHKQSLTLNTFTRIQKQVRLNERWRKKKLEETHCFECFNFLFSLLLLPPPLFLSLSLSFSSFEILFNLLLLPMITCSTFNWNSFHWSEIEWNLIVHCFITNRLYTYSVTAHSRTHTNKHATHIISFEHLFSNGFCTSNGLFSRSGKASWWFCAWQVAQMRQQ